MAGPTESSKIARRKLLQGALQATGAIIGVAAFAKSALAEEVCRGTPPQTEGPFYPVDDQLDKDANLTQVDGRNGRAQGDLIYIGGVVRDDACQPVAGALVEIWQACKFGRYDHPGDTSGLRLDPDFQYWGQAVTDANGEYLFKTIVPGSYPAGRDWIRPPHIHYKVTKRGYRELTTQLYFEGNALNDQDLILQDVPASQRASVIVHLGPPLTGQDPEAKNGRFDLTIRRLRR